MDGSTRHPRGVVTVDLADLTAPELRQRSWSLQRRVEKLEALLRLALALVTPPTLGSPASGCLPDAPRSGSYEAVLSQKWEQAR